MGAQATEALVFQLLHSFTRIERFTSNGIHDILLSTIDSLPALSTDYQSMCTKTAWGAHAGAHTAPARGSYRPPDRAVCGF